MATSAPIRRKPVATANTSSTPPPTYDDVLDDLIDDYLEPPESPLKHSLITDTKTLAITEIKELTLDTRPSIPPRQFSVPLVSSPSEISVNSTASAPGTPKASRSIWKSAVDETIYFAGGLISHPFESTRHFSVLRHSPGLVYFKGPATSVTITIFGDSQLPHDRSFWLQRKGFSGDMGMAASALLGTTGNWIDVTPSFEAVVSDVSESDERAWQRDIKKFLKKASKDKRLSKHVIRETCVIRIPASASDGYLRIVMCSGQGSKKTLCPSPVFRIASTSSDVSILRGASLKTMPLEAGLKVASVVGTQYVQRFVGPALAAQGIVQSKVAKKLQPGRLTKQAEKVAIVKSGVKQQLISLEENFDPTRDAIYDAFHEEGTLEAPPEVVGPDTGPEQPFPVSFDGKVAQGTGQGLMGTGIPTANLAGVPSDLLLRLNGIYIGWAAVQPMKGAEGISHEWHEAIITIGPSPYAAPRLVPKNIATVHIIHDFGTSAFFGAKLKVVIMAFLRRVPKPDRAGPPIDIAAAVARDTDIAIASLSREHWQCDMTLHRIKTEKSQLSTSEKYVDVRSQVQKRVDSVPVHWAGVRTARSELKDQAYGRGGLYIRR
ncbi:Uu.00g056560.m01.CDS01 [Anthostomella pinea]|uniref:Riboflavin kinase n=1 Tax=Anthostomella pinea TaxID=933095 RepID=A0AAI8VRK3_9PEZI|nr:Uu.00g056560.m01.CDS01 [Anthostomella pinea]